MSDKVAGAGVVATERGRLAQAGEPAAGGGGVGAGHVVVQAMWRLVALHVLSHRDFRTERNPISACNSLSPKRVQYNPALPDMIDFRLCNWVSIYP